MPIFCQIGIMSIHKTQYIILRVGFGPKISLILSPPIKKLNNPTDFLKQEFLWCAHFYPESRHGSLRTSLVKNYFNMKSDA